MLAAAALLVLAGCGSPAPVAAPGGSAVPGGSQSGTTLTGTLIVFAAASLTDAFEEVGRAFRAAHPGVTVTFSFGASSGLAQQILSGAPADVFAAASPAPMAAVTARGLASEPRVFARNRLEIAVPPDNPGGVTGLADFARHDLTIALCEAAVPCGLAAGRVFATAGISPAPDTLEQDVRAALSKVRLGEVDAALVYRTDVLAAGAAAIGIPFAEADSVASDYPIAALGSARAPAAARAFVTYVLSEEGQQVLAAAGFEIP